MRARLLPMGEHALLVEVGGSAEVLALGRALAELDAAGDRPGTDWRGSVSEVVPAARTLLLLLDDPEQLPAVRHGMTQLAAATQVTTVVAGSAAAQVVLRVTYDGPDLADVAAHTGLTEEEVVRAHTQSRWRVAFIGFAPGFAYLVGGDPRLVVPRRSTPRTSVPPGSVGLAGEFSGVYPRASPGGWQLIGRTDAVLWDVDREPPALLVPGAVVRFEVDGRSGWSG